MARPQALDQMGSRQLVFADADTTFTLASPPQIAQLPMGFEVQLIDNRGTFGTANMVVTGPIGQTTSTTVTLNTAASSTFFVWIGDRWLYHETG